MDPLWGLLAFGVFFGGLLASIVFKERFEKMKELEGHLRRAADSCGLAHIEQSTRLLMPTAQVSGRWQDLHVLLEASGQTVDKGERSVGMRIVIEAPGYRLAPLTLRREGVATAVEKRLGTREIEVGDDGFDEEFFVGGPPPIVRAVLDEPTRRLLRVLLFETDLRVLSGKLQAEVTGPSSEEVHERLLPRMLPLLLDAAQRLRRPADVPQRLADNSRLDPAPGVRLQNLLALLREFPEAPATRAVVRDACADPSEEIRLRAAEALGEEGRDALLAMAGSEEADDAFAARAVIALGEHLPPQHAKAILGRTLRSRRLETARACLEAIGRGGGPDAIGVLAKVMAVEQGELAIAAAQALAQTGLASAETPLIEGLARDDPGLRVSAAEALGRIGEARAVLSLKEAAARHPDDGALRRAVRQSIAQIQARLPGASPGQLSLAAGEAGMLSLAEDERGRLSLRPPEKQSPH